MTGSFVTLVAGICNVMFSDTNGGFANFAFFMLNTAVLLTDFAADIESTVGGRLVAILSVLLTLAMSDDGTEESAKSESGSKNPISTGWSLNKSNDCKSGRYSEI
jgi:hypothetical protein